MRKLSPGNNIRYKMIAVLQVICYCLAELLTPPEIKQITLTQLCYDVMRRIFTYDVSIGRQSGRTGELKS